VSRIPGTFKDRPPVPRRISPLIRGSEGQWAQVVGERLRAEGALTTAFYVMGECAVIVAREPATPRVYRWHLSISHPSRYPTWDEIKTARYSIPELADVPLMAQLLPIVEGDEEWVNAHDNCFHLHEVIDADVPTTTGRNPSLTL
jgi:hypothetical protein